jgi:hypothetical protein
MRTSLYGGISEIVCDYFPESDTPVLDSTGLEIRASACPVRIERVQQFGSSVFFIEYESIFVPFLLGPLVLSHPFGAFDPDLKGSCARFLSDFDENAADRNILGSPGPRSQIQQTERLKSDFFESWSMLERIGTKGFFQMRMTFLTVLFISFIFG